VGIEPTLIHPVDVIIKQSIDSESSFRTDAREPVRRLRRATERNLKAQVVWRQSENPAASFTGVLENSLGYLLFKLKDLAALNVTLMRGDKIIKIDKLAYELFITQLMPAGHYPDQNGATLLKAFFADREPT